MNTAQRASTNCKGLVREALSVGTLAVSLLFTPSLVLASEGICDFNKLVANHPASEDLEKLPGTLGVVVQEGSVDKTQIQTSQEFIQLLSIEMTSIALGKCLADYHLCTVSLIAFDKSERASSELGQVNLCGAAVYRGLVSRKYIPEQSQRAALRKLMVNAPAISGPFSLKATINSNTQSALDSTGAQQSTGPDLSAEQAVLSAVALLRCSNTSQSLAMGGPAGEQRFYPFDQECFVGKGEVMQVESQMIVEPDNSNATQMQAPTTIPRASDQVPGFLVPSVVVPMDLQMIHKTIAI